MFAKLSLQALIIDDQADDGKDRQRRAGRARSTARRTTARIDSGERAGRGRRPGAVDGQADVGQGSTTARIDDGKIDDGKIDDGKIDSGGRAGRGRRPGGRRASPTGGTAPSSVSGCGHSSLFNFVLYGLVARTQSRSHASSFHGFGAQEKGANRGILPTKSVKSRGEPSRRCRLNPGMRLLAATRLTLSPESSARRATQRRNSSPDVVSVGPRRPGHRPDRASRAPLTAPLYCAAGGTYRTASSTSR